MRIVFCAPAADPAPWVEGLRALLPEAHVDVFDAARPLAADYAVVWSPPAEFFEVERDLKAVFNLGAGVDALLALDNLPPRLPVVRLGDAGMSVQMAEYVCHAVIRHTRELDRFEESMRAGRWQLHRPTRREDFPVGVMGLGVIGRRVALALRGFEFEVHGWSDTEKAVAGVECHHGAAGLDAFLTAIRIVVCVLPLTPATDSILNRTTLSKLRAPGYVINVARGAHLVEGDLIELLDSGQLAGATLDVFREEPLPAGHPFWGHAKIVMTPHIAARTLRQRSLAQIASKIQRLDRGDAIEGVVDRDRGY